MPSKGAHAAGDCLNIIWTIASKDIVDALKSKVVVSLIAMFSIVLLAPKMLPLILDQPLTVLPVYDMGDSRLVARLQTVPGLTIHKVHSDQEFGLALCSSLFPEMGLLIPAGFDQASAVGAPVALQGYVCWGHRFQAADLQPALQGQLSPVLGQSSYIQGEGNVIYPPSEGVPLTGLATINSVVMILMMGIYLVPSLLFEEKETRTMQALLVSPASIGQVVVGKALAGAFYILVTAVMVFAISWEDVVHWDMVVLFVIGGAVFSVAVGLVLGSLFEKQQDATGWMTALLLLLVGAMLVGILGMELPGVLAGILPLAPSVALAQVCRAAFSGTVSPTVVLANLGIVLAVSLPLYALVIWKVRRSDL